MRIRNMHEETYTFVKNVSIICEVNILQSRIQHDDQNLYAIQEQKNNSSKVGKIEISDIIVLMKANL